MSKFKWLALFLVLALVYYMAQKEASEKPIAKKVDDVEVIKNESELMGSINEAQKEFVQRSEGVKKEVSMAQSYKTIETISFSEERVHRIVLDKSISEASSLLIFGGEGETQIIEVKVVTARGDMIVVESLQKNYFLNDWARFELKNAITIKEVMVKAKAINSESSIRLVVQDLSKV